MGLRFYLCEGRWKVLLRLRDYRPIRQEGNRLPGLRQNRPVLSNRYLTGCRPAAGHIQGRPVSHRSRLSVYLGGLPQGD